MRILQVSAKSEQCNRSIELRIVNHCISFRFNFHFISFLKSLYTDDNNTTYNADNSCGSSTTYNTAGCHSIADQKIETSKQRKWNPSHGKRTRTSRPYLENKRSAVGCWIHVLYVPCKYMNQLTENRSNIPYAYQIYAASKLYALDFNYLFFFLLLRCFESAKLERPPFQIFNVCFCPVSELIKWPTQIDVNFLTRELMLE